MRRVYVGLVAVSVGLVAGLIGFALGVAIVTSRWRAQLPELGKVIARTNAGAQLQAEDWPNDIQLIPAGSNNDTLTVYMGVVADTDVDLAFEGDRLVSIRCR